MIFFIKFDIMVMLITSIKHIIIINNFNFDEKLLNHFKKINKKNHVASIFQWSESNWY